MLAFCILEDNIKVFMKRLLQEDTFDKLEVRSIYIDKIVKYDISCNISKENQENQEVKSFFIKWEDIKPNILNIIKGSKKPKQLKIVFSLSDVMLAELTDNATAMFLNIIYTCDDNINSTLTCTTGISQKNFSLEKKEENIWEDFVINFFKDNKINIEI